MEKRPTLNDPKEWALIRSIYFDNVSIKLDDVDMIEKLERMESKEKNNISKR